MSNGTYERIKQNCDTLPLRQTANRGTWEEEHQTKIYLGAKAVWVKRALSVSDSDTGEDRTSLKISSLLIFPPFLFPMPWSLLGNHYSAQSNFVVSDPPHSYNVDHHPHHPHHHAHLPRRAILVSKTLGAPESIVASVSFPKQICKFNLFQHILTYLITKIRTSNAADCVGHRDAFARQSVRPLPGWKIVHKILLDLLDPISKFRWRIYRYSIIWSPSGATCLLHGLDCPIGITNFELVSS